MYSIKDVLDANLTGEQRAAVVDDSSDVLVIACAGSGKSRTLAYRIAWLISEGAPPESIVAFTFTEKAADAIKQRVATALDATGRAPTELGKIHIGTIHGFCWDLLRQIDARYRQFEVLDQNGLRLFVMSRYPQLEVGRLRERKTRYFDVIDEVVNAWQNLNNELLSLEEIGDHDHDLWYVLRQVKDLLDDSNYMDFSSMIRLITDRLESGDNQASDAVSHIVHLLVDEYQDTNPLEERLIQLLRQRCESLTVVGDDDQSIYGWRGANVQNILEFTERYPGSQQHTLAHNFRSTPLIVRSADGLVKAELGANRLPKSPTADQGPGSEEFGIFQFDDRSLEAEWVADRIAALLGTSYRDEGGDRGLTYADFAILMRSTGRPEQDGSARSTAFTTALEARGILYTLEAGGSVFSRAHVALLRSAMDLLRYGQPERNAVVEFIESEVRELFPSVEPRSVADLFTRWGREIHTPVTVERRRVYPQKLLHEMLASFGISRIELDDGTMADLGVLSRLLQDVETVYMSVDTAERYRSILNFMNNIAESGYQSATDAAVRRPDAVFVSTVHKAKGLEYPVVFLVDTESQRFPGRQSSYTGWLPHEMLGDAIKPPRRAYGNDRDQEARLFYTALTRAERFLYVTHATHLPGGKTARKESPFAARLDDESILREAPAPGKPPPNDLPAASPQRRIDETVLPTTFSEIRYYLRCPRDYKYRHVWGFSPPIPEMFGFGQTVHAAIGKLHERYATQVPTPAEAEAIARDIFHLKHVPPSTEPDERPGAYERGKQASEEIVSQYARDYREDFEHRRQLEVHFEIPLRDSVLSGSIDLLLHEDEDGNTIDASVIDFKTMEGGPAPENNKKLDWTELALQVQLYAKAATDVLDANARTGAVHLLRDGQRVEVPIDDEAVAAAVANVEWAADRIIDDEFPMRPHPSKCGECDWKQLCPQTPEEFKTTEEPPPLHTPGSPDGKSARAFSEFEES